MAKTIVALFNDDATAESARRELTASGLGADGVQVEDSSSNLSTRLKSLKDVGTARAKLLGSSTRAISRLPALWIGQ